jgi:hypothetical protein
MFQRIATEVDREATFVRFSDSLAIIGIRQDIEVSEGKTSAPFVGRDKRIKSNAVYNFAVVTGQVTSNVVTPKCADGLRANRVQRLLECMHSRAIHNLIAGSRSIEERPNKTSECPVLGIANPSMFALAVLS